MRQHRLFKLWITIVLGIVGVNASAQLHHRYQSDLPSIRTAGFYKVLLPPGINARCLDNLEDLRLLDTASRQIPYIVQTDPPAFEEKNFIEWPVLSVKRAADKQTHIVIENSARKMTGELLLVIKNTDANRSVTVSGSDDKKQWFVIKENIILANVSTPGKDRFVQYLNFPYSSYAYFKIIINGENLLPINIVKAGMYMGSLKAGNFTRLPLPVLHQTDSTNRKSYISVSFADNYPIDKIQFGISGPKYFRRQFDVVDKSGRPLTDGFVASSDATPVFPVKLRSKSFTVVVDNNDNQPLAIDTVSAFQLNRYLWAYLEPGANYRLAFGDSTATLPRYDLAFFKDLINQGVTELKPGAVVALAITRPVPGEDANGNKWLLWGIMGAVLALMLVLTLRMTKEIKNSKGDE